MQIKTLEVGQIWLTKSAKHQVLILCIETLQDKEIIHISIVNSENDDLPLHMPFSKSAFEKSVDVLFSSEEEFTFPAYGYNYWKKEFFVQKAGIYGIKIDEALAL